MLPFCGCIEPTVVVVVVMLIVWRSSVDVVFFIEETPPLKVPDFSRRGRAGDCIPRRGKSKLVPFTILTILYTYPGRSSFGV